ncbi:heterokaryon incompatibility protein-domain-containing protein [Immersiella caudata]|uniref:Heterokaryon incompatibility protein-domain-containing protein n=1 Tax=Immersiella caudata TaxID=314043 RepID=A0AA40BZ89_9PEZI|nr:heterokaryon incompatibility protein-domain-containing protein [Immersiella caudata]
MTDDPSNDCDLTGSGLPRMIPPIPCISGIEINGALSASPYTPIDPSTDTIRLFRLEGGLDDTIRGSLIRCSLSTASRYTALSYEWGSPDNPKEICINGIAVQIRRNLWEALNAITSINFRPPRPNIDDQVGTLWIDSICIDQSNTAEKNHQVQQMAAIYSTAASVISWLGPHTPQSTMLFEWGGQTSLLSGWKGTDAQTSVTTLGSAAKQLLEREYWTRLWIIQEVLLAQDHQLLCGRDCFSAYTFFDAWTQPGRSIIDKFSPPDAPCDKLDFVDVTSTPGYGVLLMKFADFPESVGSFYSFYDLFDMFHDRKCVNPYDKIYGLVGIVTIRGFGTGIEVDYAKSPEQLCCDVITAVWEDLRRDPPNVPLRTSKFVDRLLRSLQLQVPNACDSCDGARTDGKLMPVPERVANHLGYLAKVRPSTFRGLAGYHPDWPAPSWN